MRSGYAILIVLLAGATGFAQQSSSQPPAQPSSQEGQSQSEGSSQPKKLSPSEANPFPEAQSQKAQDAVNGTAPKTDHPDYSSSHVDLKRFSPDADRESRISNGAGGYIHDPQLAAKDVKVGNFYLQTRAYKGAYDRFKEATLVAPENADAVFGLAESARGLGMTKVAVTNYTVYLDAFPDGKRAKQARKALAELNAGSRKQLR